jgi:hypothetical protein
MKINPDGSLEENNSDIFPVSENDLAIRDVLIEILDVVKPDVANVLRVYKVKGDKLVLDTLTALKNLLGGASWPWVTLQGETLPLRAIHRISRDVAFTQDDELQYVLELNKDVEVSGMKAANLVCLRFVYENEEERDCEYDWLRSQMKNFGVNFLD